MGEQLDYTTLKWVKDEIQESLSQTQQALEAFIEDPSDTTQIRFCATYLHQVYGTLQMVEIYGAALLAEEMEKVVNALLNDQVSQKDDAYDVLIRAAIQLPSYLESLERGQPDIPVVLTPLLNDLRAARGEPLLSENAFFSPDLDVLPPPRQNSPAKSYPEPSTYARKLRPIFQVSLLGWFREKDTVGSLKKLAAVLRELQNACDGEGARRLWWVAGGIIEALLEDGLETSSSVKMLMGQVDREIKRLIDQGEEVLTAAPRSELLKNCLFYVGSSSSNGPRARGLKHAFNLAELLPYGGSMDQAMDDMKGSTADILQNVSSVIKDDLLHVKDQLDIFVRDSDRDIAELQPLGESLGRTADTLAMLGLGDLRKVIQGQATSIEQLVARGDKPDDNALMEMASALLYVEASLDNVTESQRNGSEAEAPDLSVHDDDEPSVVLLPPSEQAQITNLVIKEAREVLADVKEGFNTFAVEPTQFDAIEESPAKLVQIQGALAVMNFTRAADLLGAATAFIRDDVLAARAVPDGDQLDTLADAITSIEYFLEAVQEGRSHPEGVLAVAAVSVEQLGHSAVGTFAPVAPPPLDASSEERELPDVENLPGDEKIVELDSAKAGEADDTEPSENAATTIPEELTTASGEEIYPEEHVDEEILEIFIEEADEVLGTMTDCLHAWRANLDDQKSLETLRRSYHTIKGSGRLAGAMVMGDFAWTMEYLLNRVMENKINPSPALFNVLEYSETALRGLLAHLKGETRQRPPIRVLGAQAEALASGENLNASEIFNPVETANATPALDDNTPVELEEPGDTGQEIVHEENVEQVPPPEPAETVVAAAEAIPEPAFDPVLVDVFRNETAVHLETVNHFLRSHGDQPEAAVDDDLHRALHTLHGSARMANVTGIAEISEPMDRLVRTLGEKELPLSAESLAVLRDFADSVERQAVDFELVDIETPDNTHLHTRITRLLEQAQDAPSAAEDITRDTRADSESVEVDSELVGIFLEEANEILGNIDGHMQAWRDGDDESAAIRELQRALHTLKGGARLANAPAISDLTHALESVLETVDEGQHDTDAALPDLVQRGMDWLAQATEHVRNNTIPEPDVALLEQIANLGSVPGAETVLIEARETPDNLALDGADADPEQGPETTGQDVPEEEEENEPLFDQIATEPLEYLAETEVPEEAEESTAEPERVAESTEPFADDPPTEEIEVAQEVMEAAWAEAPSADVADAEGFSVELPMGEPAEIPDDVQAAGAEPLVAQENTGKFEDVDDQPTSPTLEEPSTEEMEENTTEPERVAEATEPFAGDPPTEEIEVVQEVMEAAWAKASSADTEEFPAESPVEKNDETPDDVQATDAEPSVAQGNTEEFEDVDDRLTSPFPEEPAVESGSANYDPDLLEVFLEEAEEIQESTERVIVDWSGDRDNLEHVAELQRLLHTLKGGARMANVVAVGDLAHVMESLLERITEGRLQPAPEHPELIQTCHDWFVGGLERARKLLPTETPQALVAQINAAIRGETVVVEPVPEEENAAEAEAPLPPTEAEVAVAEPLPEVETEEIAFVAPEITARVQPKKAESSDEQVRVRADLLNELVNFSGEINIYNSRIAQQLGASRFNLAELQQTVLRLQEQLRKFEIETEAQIMYRHETSVTPGQDDFDPLEMDRFSTMQQLSRGMVESLGDLVSIQSMLENLSGETDVLLLQQNRITGELYEGLMRTRMVAFSTVLPRLRRILRQTAKETGKQAEFLITGAEGELDRTQLNRLVPALEHILRNAVDHGLEPPEQRQQIGKPATGRVHLHFTQQGSEVVLAISDDGAGVSIDMVREKAIEKGRMLADADLGDQEILAFILESGFTTATEVTQISGRGVGLDVVNTEIKQLGGTLHIHSEVGKGTEFILRLPLTVLVNQALLVQVAESTYAIQLPNVEHVVRLGHEELLPLSTGEVPVLEYAGNQYRYLNLGTVLHGLPPQMPTDRSRVPLMLIRSGDHRIALHVDALLGRQEIVIKSVGPQLSSVGILSGATILPDGTVALILDVPNLVRSALAQLLGDEAPLLPTVDATTQAEKVPTIMVVDDSITVRKVTERLLKRYDYNVITAKDGVDALTIMLEQVPDTMLLDVEMPRMDGYELATTMRNDERLKSIPIIMITSRTGEKHRKRALEIGVNKYMGKPYQEQELIANIQLFTGETAQ